MSAEDLESADLLHPKLDVFNMSSLEAALRTYVLKANNSRCKDRSGKSDINEGCHAHV